MPAYCIICENNKKIWKNENDIKFPSYEAAENYAKTNKIEYIDIIDGTENNIRLQRKIADLHKN